MTGTPLTPAALAQALTAAFVPGQAVDLRGSRVEGAVDLSGKVLCGFDLTGSVFTGPVTLQGTHFRGLTWFRDCTFLAGVSAEGALFGHDARFDGSRIAAALTLSRAELRGQLVLDRATCEGPVWLDRIQVLGSLSLGHTQFAATVSLEGAEALGGLWADHTDFRGRVNAQGMEVHGRNWLRGARLARPVPPTPAPGPLARQIHSYGYLWD